MKACDLEAHDDLRRRLVHHLRRLYPDLDPDFWAQRLLVACGFPEGLESPTPHQDRWDQRDAILITYGGTIVEDGERPLRTLHRFLRQRLRGAFTMVHLLPFFPYSSDDGFAVIDYSTVDPRLGTWDEVQALAGEFRLMADVVLNHASRESRWFRNFLRGRSPGAGYFMTATPDQDLSAVVRPRASPLLVPVETADGLRHCWCTFSEDQVDLDFHNPDVLREFVKIIGFYMDRGVRIFRLDAVAFLWKEIGSSCIHLPQTHEVIRLLRTLVEFRDREAILISETNVPQYENLTYFGNADEAHGIYNFSLPPLLVHAMVTGCSEHLDRWLLGLPPTQEGTTFINFIASHDGIGLRPAEGMLGEEEMARFLETMERFGGLVSLRSTPRGTRRPYEVNISLFDALAGTQQRGPDGYQVERFLCAHKVMFALKGIPAIYIQSLLASPNDRDAVAARGHKRAINRRIWRRQELDRWLDDPDGPGGQVLAALLDLLELRGRQPAFHPTAAQFPVQLHPQVFAFWRRGPVGRQNVVCIHNLSDLALEVDLHRANLPPARRWYELLGATEIVDPHGTLRLEPYGCAWISDLDTRDA